MAGDVAQEAGRARHILVPNGNSANIGRPSSTASYMAKASPRGAPTTEMPPLRHHYRPSKRLHREANPQSEEILPPAPPSRRYSSEEKAQREHVHNTRFQRQDNQSAEVVPKHGRKHRLPEIITLHDDRFCGRPGHLHSHFSDSSPEASGAEDEDDNNDDVDAMLASAAITGILLLRAASKPKLVHEVVVVSSPTSPTEEGEIFELEL